MSDIKLFKIGATSVSELAAQSPQIERSLQRLFEANLENLLGVRFLSTEHTTGPVHGGRIDTLGLDEDGCPVIIEYKRSINENVINQGLFYLDWLMDHKKDFEWLVLEKLGSDAAKNVDWSAPRLLCIAGDFTRYDTNAVKQINRNIELIRHRRFGNEFMMIELIHAPRLIRSSAVEQKVEGGDEISIKYSKSERYLSQSIAYRIQNSPPYLRDIFESTKSFLIGLGDDVQVKELEFYIAFKRIKNFVCLEVYPQKKAVTAFLKLDPTKVLIEPGFTRDMTNISHFGTGNLEVSMRSIDDMAKAQPLFQRAYEGE